MGAEQSASSRSFTLRGPRPGDIGWIIHRQAVLYNEEYGWDEQYEALPQQFDITDPAGNIACPPDAVRIRWIDLDPAMILFGVRSEEHTSELQSRFDLVFRLLLEKKNVYCLAYCM